MKNSEKYICYAGSGKWETDSEFGGYYYYYNLNVWIEMIVSNISSQKKVGVRWSIDNWKNYHDSLAFIKQRLNENQELWRVEIVNFVTTGWRNGTYGGPNGEQPSSNIWNLWGTNKQQVKCLPLVTAVPDFEFALFLKVNDNFYWDNNSNKNYQMSLAALKN